MLLEYAEASFECMEHRFRQPRGLACVKRVLQEYALANDVGLQFDDVPVGLGKMLLSMTHGFAGNPRRQLHLYYMARAGPFGQCRTCPLRQLQDDASIATARVAYDASGLGRCDSRHGLLFE